MTVDQQLFKNQKRIKTIAILSPQLVFWFFDQYERCLTNHNVHVYPIAF